MAPSSHYDKQKADYAVTFIIDSRWHMKKAIATFVVLIDLRQ